MREGSQGRASGVLREPENTEPPQSLTPNGDTPEITGGILFRVGVKLYYAGVT